MQEEIIQDTPNELVVGKTSKFQPIIPIPTILKPHYVEGNNKENLRQSFVLVTKKNGVQQLQKYQSQCKRLNTENQELQGTLCRIYKQKLELQSKINSLNTEKSETQEKKKRFRRVANEIPRSYQCPNQKCNKSYGTDASLVQHIKLKHNQYYSTKQFQSFIQQIRYKNTNDVARQPLAMMNLLQNL